MSPFWVEIVATYILLESICICGGSLYIPLRSDGAGIDDVSDVSSSLDSVGAAASLDSVGAVATVGEGTSTGSVGNAVGSGDAGFPGPAVNQMATAASSSSAAAPPIHHHI
jgi:hypothetical protein